MDNVSVPPQDSQVVMILEIVMLGMVDMLIYVAFSMKRKK